VSTEQHQRLSAVPTSGAGGAEGRHTIGKYRLIRDLGVGGMAQVFLAAREGPEGFSKPYVVKRILPELSRDEQFANMFVIEAKVAAMLDHPNIAHVFEFEIENGDYYLVLEYVAGASLERIMRASRKRSQPLGPQVGVEVGAAVAQALVYAHELTLPDGRALELVHRDISPGNVLISRDGVVKLTDFGVVKTAMTATVVGVVKGKWAYMSPEQIRGQAVDQRSDLFSLGIVLYEVITGWRLFRGDSVADTATRVVGAVVQSPRVVVPDIDPGLEHIVMKLLERDPQARYQSASALSADLEVLRAAPAFAGGASRLRSLVRTFFPEECETPAFGISLAEPPRPSPVDAHPTVGSLKADPNAAPRSQAARATSSDGVGSGVGSWKLIAAVAAACLLASAIFWMVAF
jgi:eukaryotic-like serine/threonine-protein kinase